MDPLAGQAIASTLQHAPALQINPLAPPSAGQYSQVMIIVVAVIAALGGGALGASLGALPAFIMTGFLVIAGAVATAIGLPNASATIYAAAWGPMFGPHVGFQAGTAAHAYAAKYKPEIQEDPKNILVSLGTSWDILAVGAIFGAVAQLLKMGTDIVMGSSGAWGFAHIAWVIVLMAFVHRLVFGYSLIGDREATAERVGSDASDATWLSFRYDQAEPHAGHQFYFSEGILLGALAGVIAGWVALMTGSPWLPFGISAASLFMLETDFGLRDGIARAGTPITHQITLPAAVAALAAFGMKNPPMNPLIWALIMAVVFGILGEIFRMLGSRIFYAWGETHLDPPAVSIVVTVILLVLASNLGIIGANAFMGIGPHWF